MYKCLPWDFPVTNALQKHGLSLSTWSEETMDSTMWIHKCTIKFLADVIAWSQSKYLGCYPPLYCWSHPHSKCWNQLKHWRHCWLSLSSGVEAHRPGGRRQKSMTKQFMIRYVSENMSLKIYIWFGEKTNKLTAIHFMIISVHRRHLFVRRGKKGEQ